LAQKIKYFEGHVRCLTQFRRQNSKFWTLKIDFFTIFFQEKNRNYNLAAILDRILECKKIEQNREKWEFSKEKTEFFFPFLHSRNFPIFLVWD